LAATGPNGSGKSTLLRVLAGLLAPAQGSFAIGGVAPDADPRTQAHYVGHRDATKNALTARENLAFWTAFLGAGQASGLPPDQALALMGLARAVDLPAGVLSAGQRRRLALARLLTAPRPIWILDEPMTALDAAAQQTFGAIIVEHLAAGGLVIAATHAPLGFPAQEIALGAA
jgi:heme exporter protein A